MTRPSGEGTERSTTRIEAFSDGVFAIAIIVLVLDLRIPADAGSDSGALLHAILGLWPSYFAYGLSFTMISIYWANHHGSSWVSGCWRQSRGVRPSDPYPIADYVFPSRLLVVAMADIVH